MPTNPTHKDVSLLVERLRATEANCNFGSTLCARDAHAAADLLSRARPAGLVEALKERLRSGGPDRDEWTDAGMEDAFFRWPVIERELRACTCHPDDRPEGPCPQKFAARDCSDTADRREAVRRIANDIYLANSDVLCEADCKEIESIVERAIASLIAGPPENR